MFFSVKRCDGTPNRSRAAGYSNQESRCPECGHEYNMGNPEGKAIVFQAGLSKEQYEIITVDDPDNLNKCYQKLMDLTMRIAQSHGDCQVLANYTGGTKTMSAAMVLVIIMSQQWDISLNIGPLIDLIRGKGGDVPVVIDKWKILCLSQVDFLNRSLKNYNYRFVANSVGEMLTHPLDRSHQDKFIEARAVCESFDLWDTFDHNRALELIEPYGSKYYPYIIDLKKILGKSKASGYELVSDLILLSEMPVLSNHG